MRHLQDLTAFLKLYLYSFYLLLVQLFFSAKSRSFNLPDSLYGTTVILSGATSGIGHSLCRLFQKYDACVISLVKRDHDSPSNLYIEADLSDLDSLPNVVHHIRALLNAIPKNARRKVILFNAAGSLNPSLVYSVNLQAPSILAFLLADTLNSVVFLGSAVAHCASLHRHLPLLVPPKVLRNRYPASKLLLHSICQAFSQNLSLRAVVVHPGIVATNLYNSEPGPVGFVLRSLLPFLAWTPEMSAFRVLDVLQQAKVFCRAPQFGADYWDTRNLRMCPPPKIALETRSPSGKLIVDQVWEELRELVDLIEKFNTSQTPTPSRKGDEKIWKRDQAAESEEEEEIIENGDGNVEGVEIVQGRSEIAQVIQQLSGATVVEELP